MGVNESKKNYSKQEVDALTSEAFKMGFDIGAMKKPTKAELDILKPRLVKLRAELISSIEDIKGTYDGSTPEHDKPRCKVARNEERAEIINLITDLLNGMQYE